jgi:hypothetical protein
MTPKTYRFLSIAEAAKYANVSKEKIRKVCNLRRSADGEHVSELELIQIFGEKKDAR